MRWRLFPSRRAGSGAGWRSGQRQVGRRCDAIAYAASTHQLASGMNITTVLPAYANRTRQARSRPPPPRRQDKPVGAGRLARGGQVFPLTNVTVPATAELAES